MTLIECGDVDEDTVIDVRIRNHTTGKSIAEELLIGDDFLVIVSGRIYLASRQDWQRSGTTQFTLKTRRDDDD